MADPFEQLGISRRPAYEMFGVPDTSRGGWSGGTRRAVQEDRAIQTAGQALQDEQVARDRAREAEAVADDFVHTEPSAREKFLGDNPAITGSKRFDEIARYQKMQPSYADQTLAKSIALKIAEPEARQVFFDAVNQGQGTLAAQDMANTFMAKRKAAGELGKAGYSPDEAEALVTDRHDPAHVGFHVAKKKGETIFHKDPQAQALEKYYHVLKDRATAETNDLNGGGTPSAETMAELKRVTSVLGDKYRAVAEPPMVPATTPALNTPVIPAAPVTSSDAKAALLKKLGLTK